jgi:hypothetical protein
VRTAVNVVQQLVRATWVVQLVLGLAFWTGNATGLVDLHMLVGFLFVLGLWTMAGLAARAGVQPGPVALTAVWGLAVPVLGLNQQGLLPGSAHWLIEVLHLLVGVVAIGLSETLAARAKARLAPVG